MTAIYEKQPREIKTPLGKLKIGSKWVPISLDSLPYRLQVSEKHTNFRKGMRLEPHLTDIVVAPDGVIIRSCTKPDCLNYGIDSYVVPIDRINIEPRTRRYLRVG